jgi:soluble lytic murein transglycosylase-like protein
MSSKTPRLQLRRTRRGWMVAALVAAATSGGMTAVEFASADGTANVCPVEQTTSTETTATVPTDTTTTADPAPGCVDTTTGQTTSTETTTGEQPPAQAPAPPAGNQQAPAQGQPAPAGPDQAPEPAPAAAKSLTQTADVPEADAKTAKDVTPAHPAQDAKTTRSQPTDHKSGARHKHAHHHKAAGDTAGQSDQVYFPPVSVDWQALTPLAPPAFPGAAALSFPGPQFLLPIFQAASVQYGVPWQVLAAINEVETGWGHNQGPSSAGAIGWMQFLPSTWRTFGVDANGDGLANPADPVDAIFSAAHYLHEAGATKDLGRAIFAYNHSNRYVDDVVKRAIELGSIPDDLLTTLTEEGRKEAKAIQRATGSEGLLDKHAKITSVGRAMLLGDRRLRHHILEDKNITVYGCGREDIAAGIVDRRVLEVLQYLAARGLRPTVTSLRCGHGFYTSSGNVSEHSSGDAVDIAAINGTPILGNQGPGSITEKTIKQLLKLGGGMRPHQIISLMTFQGADNTLSLPDHANHIHVGFKQAREIAPL